MFIAVEMFGVSTEVELIVKPNTDRRVKVTLGQAIAALFPTIQMAVLTNAPITVILSTFSGVTIPCESHRQSKAS